MRRGVVGACALDGSDLLCPFRKWRFKDCAEYGTRSRCLDLRQERRMFPFLPGGQEFVVGGMPILLDKAGPAHDIAGHDSGFECPPRADARALSIANQLEPRGIPSRRYRMQRRRPRRVPGG
jgi:hypothetical protein